MEHEHGIYYINISLITCVLYLKNAYSKCNFFGLFKIGQFFWVCSRVFLFGKIILSYTPSVKF